MLLQYYGAHQGLPDTLAEAIPDPSRRAALLDCPTSKQPYVYDLNGPEVNSGGPARIIVYDATPAHNDARWGNAFSLPGSRVSKADVVVVPDFVFKSKSSSRP